MAQVWRRWAAFQVSVLHPASVFLPHVSKSGDETAARNNQKSELSSVSQRLSLTALLFRDYNEATALVRSALNCTRL